MEGGLIMTYHSVIVYSKSRDGLRVLKEQNFESLDDARMYHASTCCIISNIKKTPFVYDEYFVEIGDIVVKLHKNIQPIIVAGIIYK